MLTISAFARRTGLTPSALRFYDDCGVLTPARVDEVTGYRYYREDQAERAARLRELRAAGLPLAQVTAVLDGPSEEATAILEAHRRRLRADFAAASSALGRLLPGPPRLAGLDLASAIRQVTPAAGAPLDFVLIEADGDEVRLVATDRYRLALRVLRPVHPGTGRFVVPTRELAELGPWVARHDEVTLTGDALHAGGESRPLPLLDEEFPGYRVMLDALPAPERRVVVDRTALRDALPERGPVELAVCKDALVVNGRALPAIGDGALRIGFDPAVLGAALEASVGPDVLLEFAGPSDVTRVRSADQGSFETLVMPVALAAAGPGSPTAAPRAGR
ncbi:MerR family transcriptional regulator [Amycolatopsis endophytica]|uniref:DNA-binding transcriptional MerR regulator n=1 Tax=Amycolatopsis endophytica TaxID=860233 RepID=A0A853B4E0_9PSEU|nr:MerR family transcriptional regulator [Amycolatopsis endophytica]NYI90063.1 DNA-binding transcriptional MerR regulator [Amycolatopsis endophytica]